MKWRDFEYRVYKLQTFVQQDEPAVSSVAMDDDEGDPDVVPREARSATAVPMDQWLRGLLQPHMYV